MPSWLSRDGNSVHPATAGAAPVPIVERIDERAVGAGVIVRVDEVPVAGRLL